MHPTTFIELSIVFSVIIVIAIIALLFPKKVKKMVWILSAVILIAGVSFYTARPFIVEHQTEKAVEQLEKHLEETYPGDAWGITDTDEHRMTKVVFLHVIFVSEPDIVYEYTFENKTIEQVGMWMLSGEPVEESGVKPKHSE